MASPGNQHFISCIGSSARFRSLLCSVVDSSPSLTAVDKWLAVINNLPVNDSRGQDRRSRLMLACCLVWRMASLESVSDTCHASPLSIILVGCCKFKLTQLIIVMCCCCCFIEYY